MGRVFLFSKAVLHVTTTAPVMVYAMGQQVAVFVKDCGSDMTAVARLEIILFAGQAKIGGILLHVQHGNGS